MIMRDYPWARGRSHDTFPVGLVGGLLQFFTAGRLWLKRPFVSAATGSRYYTAGIHAPHDPTLKVI